MLSNMWNLTYSWILARAMLTTAIQKIVTKKFENFDLITS